MSDYFKTVAPLKSIEGEGTVHECTRYDHDAFGEVSVTRRMSGGESCMFGSDIGHRNVVVIKLARAHQLRSYNQNTIETDDLVAEFEVSEVQWSKIVASAGGGSTPVTLRQAPARGVRAVGMPMIEPMTLRQQFDSELEAKFAKYMSDGQNLLAQLESIADSKGSVSKTDIKKMREQMSALVEGLPRNFGFMHEQFQRAMDEVAQAAKVEVESYVSGVVRQTGMASLAQNAPTLGQPSDGEREPS